MRALERLIGETLTNGSLVQARTVGRKKQNVSLADPAFGGEERGLQIAKQVGTETKCFRRGYKSSRLE